MVGLARWRALAHRRSQRKDGNASKGYCQPADVVWVAGSNDCGVKLKSGCDNEGIDGVSRRELQLGKQVSCLLSRPCLPCTREIGLRRRAYLSFEFLKESAEAFAFKLVGHRTSNKPGKSTCADSLTNGDGKFAGHAYRELGSGLTQVSFLPE